ncbi:MAG: ABC transporter substrate-binding protein [Burkholderiales bacterium]|nr:ABC transporter substrate-binding protein [Burkholderiales bacterium]
MTAFARSLHATLALMATLALLAGDGIAAEKRGTLRVGDVKGGMQAVLEASGALADAPYEVQWTLFPAGAPLLEALNAGALDIGVAGDIPFLFVHAAGAPIRIVGGARWSPQGQAIVVPTESPIRTVADLKGKRIAVNRGGWGHFLALAAIERAGLRGSDVELSFLSPVDGRSALTAKSVDAWSTWAPYTSTAVLLDGARVVTDGEGLVASTSFVLASDHAIANKRAVITDYLKRLAKAQRWALDNIDVYAKREAALIGIPVPIAQDWFRTARITPFAVNLQTVKEFQQAADLFYRFGVLPKAIQVDPAFDLDFGKALSGVR